MSIEKSFETIAKLGYLVQSIYQSHYTGWGVNLRSPHDWTIIYADGSSLAEAADKAASRAKRRGPAVDTLKAKKKRVRLDTGGSKGKRRVKLTGRTRL